MSQTSGVEIKFTVLQNGLDFIFSALSHLRGDPSPRDLKYAVLHINAGIELILKDRLCREHWSLVFSNVNKADLSAFSSGDFFSVDLKDCIQRLISICGVTISNGDRRALFNLKSKRNRLEHFATIDSDIAIKASSAKVLSFAIDFISSEFDLGDLDEIESELLNQIRPLLPDFIQFVTDRINSIEEELAAANLPIIECPRCTQEAIQIDDGAICRFCGYSADGDDVANEYVKSLFGMDWKFIANGGEIPIYHCPECWGESLVDVGNLKQDFQIDRLVCFSCGSSWGWDDAEFCVKCGNPFSKRRDGLPVCRECFP